MAEAQESHDVFSAVCEEVRNPIKKILWYLFSFDQLLPFFGCGLAIDRELQELQCGKPTVSLYYDQSILASDRLVYNDQRFLWPETTFEER